MCTKPCKECPYKNTAIPGYFGGHDGNDYHRYISMDVIVACHTRSKFNSNGIADDQNVSPCIGHALSQINSFKAPMPGTHLEAVHETVRERPDIEQLKAETLSAFNFIEYHNL